MNSAGYPSIPFQVCGSSSPALAVDEYNHVHVMYQSGHSLNIELTYNGFFRAIQTVLHEPLRRASSYTVTILEGVEDTSGNRLACAYGWSFSAEIMRTYLPVLQR